MRGGGVFFVNGRSGLRGQVLIDNVAFSHMGGIGHLKLQPAGMPGAPSPSTQT